MFTDGIDGVGRQQAYRDLGLWHDERIGYMLPTAAQHWPDRQYVRIGDRRLSFAQAWSNTLRMCRFLREQGIGPGDKIVLHVGNCVELIALLYASWRIGAVAIPVVPIYRVRELTSILDDARPKLIVSAARDRSRTPFGDVEEALQALDWHHSAKFVLGNPDDARDGWQLLPDVASLREADPAELPDPAGADNACLILYTSGTTSAPKGVLCTGRAILSGLDAWRGDLGLSVQDVTFTGAPLAHLGGIFLTALLPVRLGARSVILEHWDADEAVRLIEEERVTLTAGATLFLREIVERYEQGESPTHRLGMFSSSGSATPPELIRRADALGIYAFRSYGMTETFGTIAHPRLGAPVDERANYDGRVAFGTEVQIVDEDGRLQPHGGLGSIRLRSPQSTPGYTDERLNRDQIDRDGWFYPGDLGTLTADGLLTMVGRTKDIINRGGEKFSCQDIESAITSYPAIAEAAVVGKPDPRFGEVVAAFVILHPDSRWEGALPVKQHLESIKLARAKIPVEWHLIDAFPRTASGKIQKQELLKLLAAQAA